MNAVAAIVVTYNRKDLLRECIQHLKEQTISCDILVIDNASTDGTQEEFSTSVDPVFYFNTGSNLGGAGGFSYGIKKAVEAGYDYLWILDDDTMPSQNALECLLKKGKSLNGAYGYLSSKVLWKDGSICTMNIQKTSKWKRITNFDMLQKVQYSSFVSLFVKSSVVKKLGLPYKEFFIWADDWEYTRRISKRYPCYYVPESVVSHWCKTNIGADIVSCDRSRLDRFKYMYRNDVVMYRQDGIEGMFYLLLRNAMHVARVLKKSDNKIEKIKLMNKATQEGFRFHPVIAYPEEKK